MSATAILAEDDAPVLTELDEFLLIEWIAPAFDSGSVVFKVGAERRTLIVPPANQA